VQPHPPIPGSIVIGCVTRLSPLQALISITVVDDIPLPLGEEFTGVIRRQDVRATEKDRVKIGECFRGGDVVRSQVVSACRARLSASHCSKISLGDARSYFVTTARNDLGVIFATSEAGNCPNLVQGCIVDILQAQPWNRCPGKRCGVPRLVE
jgi:exosome complex component CSL4